MLQSLGTVFMVEEATGDGKKLSLELIGQLNNFVSNKQWDSKQKDCGNLLHKCTS